MLASMPHYFGIKVTGMVDSTMLTCGVDAFRIAETEFVLGARKCKSLMWKVAMRSPTVSLSKWRTCILSQSFPQVCIAKNRTKNACGLSG